MFRIPEPETKVEEGIEEINSSINNSINEAISSNPLGQAVDNAATNNGSAVTDPASGNRTVLSPNTPPSAVDDTAISVDSGANSADSVIISPELNDSLAEGSSPAIAENILADGSVLYTGHVAAGQRLIVDKDITDIAKPWDHNPGEQYVIESLQENASAPYDIDDFEYAVIYEAIEANTGGYKHEIRASAPDSDANIKITFSNKRCYILCSDGGEAGR